MISALLALSLVGSCVAWPVGRRLGRRSAGWVLAIVPAGLFAGFLRFGPSIEAGRSITERWQWAPSLGVEVALRLDGFAFLFCLLVTGIGALVVIYAGAYMAERSAGDRARFIVLILLFMTAMLGAVLADDLFMLLLCWEATSVISFLLIGFDVESPSARRSALMSLRVTAAGGLGLLVATLLFGTTLGSYSLSGAVARAPELAHSPWILPILSGVLVAAFTKSAQFPFHFWLPNAMQAPTPASAYLHSATMVKLGVYLLARFEPVIGAVPAGRDTVIMVALATMLVGAFQALRAENYKAVLAYSTIVSLGILVMMVGLNGPMASVATVGFLLAHALYKATLFFCAGTVLHATGLTKLRQLGGLRRFLPVTAAASALASLSMAGLPPFLGFVSKEFLFEAQIQSSWDAIPMAVAVLVNAVMVAVAGVVTLRPFFMGAGRVREVRHREVPGLVVGPIVLALLGLLISLEPDWIDRTVLRPAVGAIYGRPVEVQIALWHGVTPILLLSAVVVAIGTLLFVYWRPIHQRLRAQSLIGVYEAEHAYSALLRGIEAAALGIAGQLQRSELRDNLAMIIAAAAAFVLWGLIAAGVVPRVPIGADELRIAPAVVALGAVAGGVAAARARSLLAAMVGTGLVGLVVALLFLMNGAPDLALTQFAVESLTVVLLTAALLALPLAAPGTRAPRARTRDAVLASALSLPLFLALLDMSVAPQHTELAEFFGTHSYAEAFGRNVVNVILVDFRGFDTLGETTVIALSCVIAWSLLGPLLPERRRPSAVPPHVAFVLEFASPAFFWLLSTLSVIVLLRGHNEIGGGFVGGLMAALAFSVLTLTHGVARARARLRLHPLVLAGSGLLLALCSGIPGLIVSGNYLHHVWLELNVFGVHVRQGTTLLFDLGVYAAVLGTILAFLFGLTREAQR
jgi:multicomponent Na+:H+ antiporter subunit A